MTRERITDTVVEQLADVLAAEELDDPNNRAGAQFLAQNLGHDDLAAWIARADAATYHEAMLHARERVDRELTFEVDPE